MSTVDAKPAPACRRPFGRCWEHPPPLARTPVTALPARLAKTTKRAVNPGWPIPSLQREKRCTAEVHPAAAADGPHGDPSPWGFFPLQKKYGTPLDRPLGGSYNRYDGAERVVSTPRDITRVGTRDAWRRGTDRGVRYDRCGASDRRPSRNGAPLPTATPLHRYTATPLHRYTERPRRRDAGTRRRRNPAKHRRYSLGAGLWQTRPRTHAPLLAIGGKYAFGSVTFRLVGVRRADMVDVELESPAAGSAARPPELAPST